MPKVYNIKDNDRPPDVVYVGRPSKWGNPYIIGKDGNRKKVIDKFWRYVLESPTLMKEIKEELKGKDLVCHCAPLPCHGDVLLEIANRNELFGIQRGY